MIGCNYDLNYFRVNRIAVKIRNYEQYEQLEKWFQNVSELHIYDRILNHKKALHCLREGQNISIAVFVRSNEIELFPASDERFGTSWKIIQFEEMFSAIQINKEQLEELLL